MGVVAAFARLWTEYDLLGNVFMSWWRIAQAFLWSAAIAIPLGLLMGSFRWLHSFINPIAEPMRSMPITAFVPAFIGLFGMDEKMKVAFLFFGMFFYLLALVVEEADRVDNALLETAMTLGARKPQLLWLMFRASFPAIFGSFRILYDRVPLPLAADRGGAAAIPVAQDHGAIVGARHREGSGKGAHACGVTGTGHE